MNQVSNCLSKAIDEYRRHNLPSEAFSNSLRKIEEHGLGIPRESTAGDHRIRQDAADFILLYVELALVDHRISETEMDNIRSLKSIYAFEEGDLLAMRRSAIADLLRFEMSRMLSDERVDDLEVLAQEDLQRAFDLGYDEYLQLTRESIRLVVDQILDDARGRGDADKAEIVRRLQALRTVIKVNPETMRVIWS